MQTARGAGAGATAATTPTEQANTAKQLALSQKALTQDELLKKASEFSDHDAGYGRDEHGRLPGWTEWAASHPQREEPVVVCHGREEWYKREEEAANNAKNDGTSCLSVVSWNTLSDTLYEEGKEKKYSHTPTKVGSWTARFPLILDWLTFLSPDVLFLQEVDFVSFEQDFLPRLKKLGYDGKVQPSKKQNGRRPQPCGVATFWKANVLELLAHKSFSRTMALQLRTKHPEQPQDVCVVNVHLESKQTQEAAEKRARQLNSPLQWASKRGRNLPVILGGDCNTGSDASLFHVLRDHKWHGHDLASVYEHPASHSALPVNRATIACPGHHYVIDHLLYTHSRLQLRVVLNALTPTEIDKQLGPMCSVDKGFPNEFCPSDHIPVGAIFEFQENGVATTDIEEEVAKAPALDEHRKMELKEEWEALCAESPAHTKGEPPPEEIAARRAHKEKIKAWKWGLNNDTEQDFVATLVKSSENRKKRGRTHKSESKGKGEKASMKMSTTRPTGSASATTGESVNNEAKRI